MQELGLAYEVLIIDDGSRDGTFERLIELKQRMPELVAIRFRRNFGQTAGLACGFREATGAVVVVYDTDLQQDPRDIKILLDKIYGGYDVVSGHRVGRKHSFAIRASAWIGFVLRNTLLGVPIRDTACSPNAYRREALVNLDLYGEMHRFLVPLLYWRGFRVTEVSVPHHARGSGRSKYRFTKSFRAFLDLLVMKFWMSYSVRPMQFFGGLGFLLGAAGFLVGIYVIIQRASDPAALIGSTLPLFSVFLMLTGAQFVLFGLLADTTMRNYFKDRPSYYVERIIR